MVVDLPPLPSEQSPPKNRSKPRVSFAKTNPEICWFSFSPQCFPTLDKENKTKQNTIWFANATRKLDQNHVLLGHATSKHTHWIHTTITGGFMLHVHGIVIRTHDGPNNRVFTQYLHTSFGSDYCVMFPGNGGRRAGAYAFVARLGHLTIDHASPSRRSTVPTISY